MSLVTRLTALAQAVGADIKALNAKVQVATTLLDTFHTVGAVGEPAYLNSWTAAVGYTVRFRKDPFGKVRLSGVLKPGTATAVFVLPMGYRPIFTERGYVCQTNSGTVFVYIGIDGTLFVSGTTMAYVYLDTIEFDTELVTTMAILAPKGDKGDKGDPSGLLASASLAGVTTYDISGLNGDTDGAYRLILDGIFTPPDGVYRGVVVKPNAVTLAGVPLVIHEWAYSGATAGHSISAGGTNNFATGFTIGGSTYAPLLTHGRMEAVIMAKTGRRRVSRSAQSYRTSDGLKYGGRDLISVWDDTTTVINSLRIDFGGLSFTGDLSLLLANHPNP